MKDWAQTLTTILATGMMIFAMFSSMNNSFDTLNGHLDSMDARLGSMESRLTGVENRLSAVAERVSYIEGHLTIQDRTAPETGKPQEPAP